MIVRLTVGNNSNFYIRHFMESFFTRGSNFVLNTEEEVTYSQVMNLLMSNEVLDTKDKDFILEFIKKRFYDYLKGRVGWFNAGIAIETLELDLLDTFIDKNENGKVYYWFAHSKQIINQ